ncbi:PaaX family transcriptional regulator [Pseudoclavibacter helvolus]|uniref:PaaX family transcriptional regulator n=1 Tax=Pseudoclavibacter helvolus TaxID=255205 RepID=UPI0024AE4602|nr:PaaX family transcriptional regulator C-terminal domain-containing protein [Pseudoclavibacter helvolus]
MHARDVVGAVFDAYVPSEGMRVAHLSELFAALGIEAATTRATLSRMRREGLLASRREGRETVYATTAKFRGLLSEERARSGRLVATDWDGRWTMVLYQIPENDRGRREKVKRLLLDDGFGQLNATTWISPHDDRERMHRRLGCHDDPTIVVVNATTGGLEEDQALVARCWDLDEIASTYQAFLEQWSDLSSCCDILLPKEAFQANVEIVSDWRHFPSHDPRLPLALQPRGWPAQEAHEVFHRAEEQLRSGAQDFVDATIRNGA